MNLKLAKMLLIKHGFDVLEQRGFYSHFIRVRKAGTYETVTTLDIEEEKVDFVSICDICFKGNPYIQGIEITF